MKKLKMAGRGEAASKEKPREFAKHKGGPECILLTLEEVVGRRMRDGCPGSYTSGVAADRGRASGKLLEECNELLCAEGRTEVVWEAADMLYFTVVYLRNRGVPLADVLRELERRRLGEKVNQRYPPIPD